MLKDRERTDTLQRSFLNIQGAKYCHIQFHCSISVPYCMTMGDLNPHQFTCVYVGLGYAS